MKNIASIVFIIISFHIIAQQDELIIPEGITYKRNFDFVNKKAEETIKEELVSPTYSLFDKLLYCGPKLWSRYETLPNTSKIEKGNIDFQVPQEDGSIKVLNGKLIQSKDDFKVFWDQVVTDFKNTDFKIRKLKPEELIYYWSIIFFDIEEPIYMIENSNFNIIVDFNDIPKVLFIEAY